MAPFLVPVFWLLLLSSRAFAGCVCPSLADSSFGGLRVEGGEVVRQEWSVRPSHLALKLLLRRGGTAAAKVSLVAVAAAAKPLAAWVAFEAGPKAPPTTPVLHAELVGKGSVAERREPGALYLDALVESNEVTLEWTPPTAGAEPLPPLGKIEKTFCIDAGTKKAIAKFQPGGFYSSRLVFPEAFFKGEQGKAQVTFFRGAGEGPVSVCATGLKKADESSFRLEVTPTTPGLAPWDSPEGRALAIFHAAAI